MLEDFADFTERRNGENWPTERENGVEYRRQGLRRSPQEYPAHLTMKDLMEPFPMEWERQREHFFRQGSTVKDR